MMQLKHIYSNLSIKYKFIIFYFSIILALALLFGTYSYYNSKQYAFNSATKTNLDKVRQLTISIDYLLKDVYDVSSIICLNPNIQKFLRTPQDEFSATAFSAESQEIIDYIIASKSYISLIIVYNAQGYPIYYKSSDMSSDFRSLRADRERQIYERACALNGKPLWININRRNPVLIENNKYPKIALCRVIKDIYSMANAGLIVVCLNEQELLKLFAGNVQPEETLSILDSHHQVINYGAPINPRPRQTASFLRYSETGRNGCFIRRIAGKDAIVSYAGSGINDWTVFYTMPAAKLLRQINSFKSFSVIVVLACVLLTFPLTLLISSYLTAPLKRLLLSMRKFQEGNFEERVEIRYEDEIGELGQGYNRMVASLKDLINNVYVLQIKEREAELQALQAQINPHFLYNTLDTIYWKAERQNQAEISEMVYSLSRLFRLSLNSGQELTTVANEKELIEHYLKLQKVRYKDKLNYQVTIAAAMMDCLLPKLILQPFVENAIIHGFESRQEGGWITVSGNRQDDKLHFTVEDNGKGIDQATLDSLLAFQPERANTPAPRGGYAIRNIIERLNIYFQHDYRLHITSAIAKGTRVEIEIPARNGAGPEEPK